MPNEHCLDPIVDAIVGAAWMDPLLADLLLTNAPTEAASMLTGCLRAPEASKDLVEDALERHFNDVRARVLDHPSGAIPAFEAALASEPDRSMATPGCVTVAGCPTNSCGGQTSCSCNACTWFSLPAGL